MSNHNSLKPHIYDGRFFVSPILGCSGACCYCYLEIKNYHSPHKNIIDEGDMYGTAYHSKEFTWGRHGTIISVGAWGDIFPRNNDELISHSIRIIKYLLSWGNPVQIMSKNTLDDILIREITNSVRYPGQLLYSTTITSLDHWNKYETGTSNPIDRLHTCRSFHDLGVSTNVLLKPFIWGITDVEIERIADLLKKYHIDFCTLGVMYWDDKIEDKIRNNAFLNDKLNNDLSFRSYLTSNYLDCNGKIHIASSQINQLIPLAKFLRSRGISAFLKSSCVNSNILNTENPSKYYQTGSPYCLCCNNCTINTN